MHPLKRVFAYFIDIIIIILYAVLLFHVTTYLQFKFDIITIGMSPLKGQFIGFLTLTLPVFLYFYFMENSHHQATIGKKIVGIKVKVDSDKNRSKAILLRTICKLVPWEISHLGVHWLIYFNNSNISEPWWVFVALVVPQIIVFWYVVIFFINKDNQTPYDQWSKTQVK